MTGERPVDFVVERDETPLDPSEEELAPPPRHVLRLLWGLCAVVVVALATFAIVQRDRGSTPRAAAPSASTSPSASSAPSAVLGVDPIRVPEGNRSARPPAVCPAYVTCYSDTGTPTATLTALRRYFPSAQLTSSAEVLANRAGRFGPDLLARLVHARAGSVDITLTVGKPRRGDKDAYVHDRTGPLLHSRVTHAGSAFTVTVEIVQLGPKHRPSRAVLDRLARDPRLVVPQ